MRTSTFQPSLAVAAVASLTLAACSGDDQGTDSTTTDSSSTDSGSGPASDSSSGDSPSAGDSSSDAASSEGASSGSEGAESSEGASPSASDGSSAPAGDPAAQGESFTVVATGDVLIHSDIIAQAKKNAGGTGYDFNPMFAQVKPWLSAGDTTICNQETPLSPTNTGLTDSMKIAVFNTPHEQADALVEAGIDACSTANNHTFDQGVQGIKDTREIMTTAGVTPIGPSETPQGGQQGDGSDNPVIVDAGGHKVGVLTYSYNVANAGLSANLSSHPWMEKHMWFAQKKAGIEAQAKKAREEGAEVVVAIVHWGAEYSIPPRPEQEQLANQLLKGDQVDAIFGHHAHLPQPCSTINGKTVFYGLGNFISAQRKKPTNNFPPQVQDGLIGGVTFTADGKGGWTQQASYKPTITSQPEFVIEPVSAESHPDSWARTQATITRDATCKAQLMETPQG